MKSLLLIPVLALGLLAGSCRTMTPLDPMTMKPSDRCLPEGAASQRVADSAK
jgi:hypothetical protein